MSFYDTGNPVPSIDPRDLDDNAKHIDELVNSTFPTFVDRQGTVRKTIAGIEADADAATLRGDLAADDGATLIGAKQPFSGAGPQTQADINETRISVSDFAGADPTGASLQDSGFISAANENVGPVFVPAGIWRVSSPLALPLKAQYFGPGVIKYDNAEYLRRGGSAGVGVAENYTLFYEYSDTADVSVQFNGVPQTITWVDAYTVNAPASVSTDTVRINIANGLQRLGSVPVMVRSFNTMDVLTPGLAPSYPPAPAASVGTDNWFQGTQTPVSVTTGVNNTFAGSRAGRTITTGINNTGLGFQALYRTNGNNNTSIGSIAGEWVTSGSDNTTIGATSGAKITTGASNTALGSQAMGENQTGSFNVNVGYRSGANSGLNPYDESVMIGAFSGDFSYGGKNTFAGYRAGCGPNGGSDGTENTFIGWFAGRNQVGADFNVGVGLNSLVALTSGQNNVSVGHNAAAAITSANNNTAVGFESLKVSTAAAQTAVGYRALTANTTGATNTAVGNLALSTNSAGSDNVAVGEAALIAVTTSSNTAVGARALNAQNTGTNNTAVGFEAARFSTTASNTVAVGFRAGRAAILNGDQTAIGADALQFEATGASNTAVGRRALRLKQDTTNQDGFVNCTGIGMDASVSASNQVQLGNSATTTYVYGTVQNRSDINDKADVEDTSLGLEFIMSLRPVDYKWDMRDDYTETVIGDDGEETLIRLEKDGSKKRNRYHHGFIAQEVEQVILDSGVDFGGFQDHSIHGGCDVKSLGYDEFIAPLVKAVQELTARIKALEAKE